MILKSLAIIFIALVCYFAGVQSGHDAGFYEGLDKSNEMERVENMNNEELIEHFTERYQETLELKYTLEPSTSVYDINLGLHTAYNEILSLLKGRESE